MTPEEIEAVIDGVRRAPGAIAGLENPDVRFDYAHRLGESMGESSPRNAVVRQDAFREVKGRFDLTLQAVAARLGISFGAARRINSARLKRDGE